MGDVRVIGPAGITKVADADDVAANGLPAGYRVATAAESEQLDLERDYGGAAGAAGALATGVGKGLTVGLTDIAIAELVPGGREYLQAQEKLNPGLRTAGEVAGGTAALFIPGGQGGLLARGARAVSSPARMALRAGQAVEGGVAATRAGRLAGMAAGGAVEGALYGAAEAASEASIYDTELTGEHLLSSIGYSALIGGGASFGLGAAGRLLGKTGQGASSALSKAMRSVDGQPGRFAKALGTIADVSSGAPVGTTAKYLGDPDLVRLAQNAPEEIARQEVRALDSLEKVQNSLERYRQLYSGGMKGAEVGRKIATGNERATMEAARGWADDMAAKLDDIKASPGVANKGVKKLQDDLAALRNTIEGGGGNRQTFMALDDFKRQLGRTAYGKIKAGKGGSQGALFKILDDAYDGPTGVRKLLENDGLWGDAAKMQAAVNEAWTPFIQKGFETGIPRKLARSYSGTKGLTARRFDRKSAAALIRNLDAPENAQVKEFLREFIDDGKRFAEVAKRNRGTLGELDRGTNLAGAFDEVADAMGRVTEAKSAAEELAKLQQLDGQSGVAAGALAYAVGGIGGAGLMGAYGALRSPHSLVTKWMATKQLADAASTKLAKHSAGLFDMAAPMGRQGAQAADRPKDPRGKAKKAADRAAYIAKNSEAVRAELADGMSGISDHAPLAAGAAVAKAMLAHEHLASVAPRGFRGAPPHRDEAQKFLRRIEAIEDPGVVMRDIAKGKVSPQALETIQATRPAIFEQMRMDAAEQMADLAEQGKRLPYSQRVRLGLVFGLPSDGTIDPETLAMIHASYAASAEMQEEQQDATGGAPNHVPDMAAAFRTESERMSAESEAA